MGQLKRNEREKESVNILKTLKKRKQISIPKKPKQIKNPNDVLNYLKMWKNCKSGSGWKFNKNTQSWILRHMYTILLVNKEMFTLIVSYLDGLKGESRKRVLNEANKRALRYKRCEKLIKDIKPKKVNEDDINKEENETNTKNENT